MKQFLSFVRKEFYHILRDKRTVLILLGMPIVQIILFGFAISTEVKNARIAVLDSSKDLMTSQIVQKMCIRDRFSRVQDYFMHTFTDRKKEPMLSRFLKNDTLENAFRTMLTAETYKELRESFFEKAKSRIHILALQKDMVMPTNGIHEAVGDNNYDDMVEELDFPFQYSHQNPFPLNNRCV